MILGAAEEVLQEVLRALNGFMWSERVWLPEHLSWEDVRSTPELPLTEARDLLCAVPISFALLVFRFFLERSVLAFESFGSARSLAVRPVGSIDGDSSGREVLRSNFGGNSEGFIEATLLTCAA